MVVDTSALLMPYQEIPYERFEAVAAIYRQLAAKKRLYLPARSAREFINNRDRLLSNLVETLNKEVSVPNIKPSLLHGLEAFKQYANVKKKLDAEVEALKAIRKKLVGSVRDWRGNDPVSNVYNQVFTSETLIEPEEDHDALFAEWEDRRSRGMPPGIKDQRKADTGIGDFLIWKSILRIGTREKKDIVLVSGEKKGDWYVRGDNLPLFPRPELVAEYREASGGRAFDLILMSQLLEDFKVEEQVIRPFRQQEEANTAGRDILQPASAPWLATSFRGIPLPLLQSTLSDRQQFSLAQIDVIKLTSGTLEFPLTVMRNPTGNSVSILGAAGISIYRLPPSGLGAEAVLQLEVGQSFVAKKTSAVGTAVNLIEILVRLAELTPDSVSFEIFTPAAYPGIRFS